MSEHQLCLKFPETDTVTTTQYHGYWYDDGKSATCYDGDTEGWWGPVRGSTLEEAEKNLECYKVFGRPTKIEMVVTTVYKKMIREDVVIEKE
jgi:hypothetical protein